MSFYLSEKESFVEYDSDLSINRLEGNSKILKLNRTHFEFSSTFVADSVCKIKLPTLKNQDLEFSLSFNEGVFYMESHCKYPFRINGVLSFKSLLCKGDIVDLGHNRLKFCKENKQYEIGLDQKIITSNLNILLEGETGVGKSYLAKEIHNRSGRVGSFVHVNLSSFSYNLIESEIFGHVKGAFTGAIRDKEGAIKEAQGGTLFLDEIDSLSLELQTKLLLFLDSKKYRNVGGTNELQADVRLIFASGRSLKDLASKGEFRRDMYYRISSGLELKLLSLREDQQKIKRILLDFELEHNCVFSVRLENFYKGLKWPGNIRQLRGHLEKKLVMSGAKKIDLCEVDQSLLSPAFVEMNKRCEVIPFDHLKKDYFLMTLSRFSGDYKLAANSLEVSINTVKNVLKKSA